MGNHTARSLRLALSLGLLAVATATHAQQSDCTPPDDLKPNLAGTPTPSALNDAGVWFAQHQQYPCAIQAFATSLQTDPQQKDFRHVIFMFGASLYYAGSNKESIAALQEAQRVGYRSATLYLLLASALDADQQTGQAIAAWRLALAFDPESPTILDALSDDLLAQQQFTAVIDLLDQPRLKAVRSPKQVRNLAAALTQSNRTQEAAGILADGFNTYSDSKEIAHQLAETLTALHRDTEATLAGKLANQ